MSVWRAWALSSRGLLLVICLPVCLSQQPQVNPPDCSKREHPVVTYQGETIDTFSYIDPSIERKLKLADVKFPLTFDAKHLSTWSELHRKHTKFGAVSQVPFRVEGFSPLLPILIILLLCSNVCYSPQCLVFFKFWLCISLNMSSSSSVKN